MYRLINFIYTLVWKNISRNFIKSKFDALQIGSIKSVEFFYGQRKL